jgi:hypothetical protein
LLRKLRNVCLNIDGYSNKARRIMFNGTIVAIWRYASSIYATRLMLEKNKKKARLIACCRAYCTSGYMALTTIAAWPPFELEILSSAISTAKKKNWHIDPYPLNVVHLLDSNSSLMDLKRKIRTEIIRLWNNEWCGLSASEWARSLFPTVDSALDALIYPDFYLSQALTGHGVFRKYRYKIRKIPSPNCPICAV